MSEPSTHEASENFSVLGVDLAAQPGKTALCEIAISNGVPEITRTEEDCDDTLLMADFRRCDIKRIGIDSPFGWPIAFVNALSNHQSRAGLYDWPRNDPEVYAGPKGKSTDEYRDLKFRATDLVVWEKARKPLSVAVNSLGSVAIRNASLLSRAGAKGRSVDRSGRTGHFVEVYPAAALCQWGIDPKGKSSDGKKWCKRVMRELLLEMTGDCRKEVLESQESATISLAEGDLKLKNPKNLCCSDHVVDAFVSAVVALMAQLDRQFPPKREENRLTHPIPPGMEALAKMEGWIALPKEESLKQLMPRLGRLRAKE